MTNRPKQARLQNRILLRLERTRVDSLSELAQELAVHRSSVSRAMHLLQGSNLVSKTNGYWHLTEQGEEETEIVKRQASDQTTKAVKAVSNVVENARAIAPAVNSLTFQRETPFSLVSNAAFSGLSEAMRAYEGTLLRVASSVDLLSSMQKSMQYVVDMTAKIASLEVENTATSRLLGTAIGIDLLTSAQDSMQSVTSLVAKMDSSMPRQENIQVLLDAASKFDSVISAQEAISSLVTASERFDSVLLTRAVAEPLSNAIARSDSFASTKATMLPLIDAATKFDSIAMLKNLQSPFETSIQTSLLESTRKQWEKVTNTPNANFGSIYSTADVTNSIQIPSILESISAHSLRPTINEIAANHMLSTVSDSVRTAFLDTGVSLMQEAYESFSQSTKLSSALVEQLTGTYRSASIIDYLDETNVGLEGIVTTLENIRALDFTSKTISSIVVPQSSYLAEIGRTYKGYYADVTSNLLREGLSADAAYRGMVLPTRITSTYVDSVERAVVSGEAKLSKANSPEQNGRWLLSGPTQLDEVLQALGTNFIAMWHGSWDVLFSDSSDRIRQAAHSGRELLMQFLTKLAPDHSFEKSEIEKYGNDGKITRKMRIEKLMSGSSRSTVAWVEATARALDENYARLTAISHERGEHPQTTEKQLIGLLHVLGGLLLYIYIEGLIETSFD